MRLFRFTAYPRFSVVFIFLWFATAAWAQQYDVLIRNGMLVDGSGNPWTYADVGILGDRIIFVGRAASDVKSKQTIDAKGLVVTPGFIDMLGQSEDTLLVDKQAVSKLTQGITTEITGEGESIAPMNAFTIGQRKDWSDHFKVPITWRSLDEYLNHLERQGIGINLGTYVGAAQLRKIVLGDENRAPTPDELATMEEAMGDSMYDGAMGLSSALIYAPGTYARTEELIALAKVAAKNNGIYATHIRDEEDREMAALDEAFQIGREANIPVEIFHLKVSGQQNWGKMRDVVAKIEAARASGLDVTADQYPYIAAATSLGAAIPPKYHEGGTDALIARLRDVKQRAAIRADLEKPGTDFENIWRGVGSADGVMVISILNPSLKQYEGKTVAEIARMQNKDPMDALMDFIVEDHNNTGAVYFSMKEEDVRYAMQQPWVGVGTDYGAVSPVGPLGESKSHPRAYGSFPRILGKYVREEKLLRLEDAIRKMTSLPAQRMKLERRGMVRPDYYADITIFNPETVLDVATFENPNRPSTGIQYVLVNGVLAIEGGKFTGKLGGRPLRGPGYGNRVISPDGLRPKGKVQGVITSEDGWPLPRTKVTLYDGKGAIVGTVTSTREGRYEIYSDAPCEGCRLAVERMGFQKAEKNVNYNGSNALWFSFALPATK